MAKITIKYAPTFYTIDYLDSKRMRYKNSDIHPTYNKLIIALQKNIVYNLKHRAKNITNISNIKNEKKEPIHLKLITLKKLYDDSLITKEEYSQKKKMLLEAY